MFLPIKQILTTATVRQSFITTISTLTNGVLGAFFFFLLARLLGSTEYGSFSAAVTTITLLTTVFDLGTSQGLVKFYRKYQDRPDLQQQILKSAFISKVFLGTLAVIIFVIFPGAIANHVFHKSSISTLLIYAGFGILFSMLFSFAVSAAQATEKYLLWGVIFVFTNLTRLVFLIMLLFSGHLSDMTVTILYALMPLAGFIISIFYLDQSFLKAPLNISLFSEFFRFNKWVSGFLIISAIGSRLDILLTTRILNLERTGVYALATQMVVILPQLTSAIGAVTTPKFASFGSDIHNRDYVKKTTLFTLLIAVLASAILIPAALFIIAFTGRQYSGSFLPFLLLLLGMNIFLVTSPLSDSILYFFSKPQFFFWSSLAYSAVMLLLSLFLIPPLGITGSSLVVLLSQLFLGILCTWYYLRLSKKL